VFVVLLMARVAVHRGIFEGRSDVAFFALGGFMFPNQGEAGLVMVKRGFLPGSFVVALAAIRAFLSLMFVIFLVAAVAVYRGVFIPVFCMAVLAGDFSMFPSKRVLRFVVVETNLFPGIVGMAICAGFSDSALMLIVFLVAGITRGRCLPILYFGRMAGFALDLPGICVCPAEGEICF
jgi:hypothetical protein